jgi:NCAIR mutase (PurE)-related protein
MDPTRLRRLLERVRRGEMTPREALDALATLPFEETASATVDHHRAVRQHLPEVILCQGKTAEQCVEIARAIVARSDRCLATRASEEQAEALVDAFGDAAEWNRLARTIVVHGAPGTRRSSMRPTLATPRAARAGRAPRNYVLVVSAGTSDLPVAEEAAVTLEFMGVSARRVYDAGVAGLHRLLAHMETLRTASAIVVVAGMEGALASVVGGLTPRPVIAVPTSTGYGASFGGLAALLAMLNSCAAGVTVVNIDNGFGAGYAAGVIARQSRAVSVGRPRMAKAAKRGKISGSRPRRKS